MVHFSQKKDCVKSHLVAPHLCLLLYFHLIIFILPFKSRSIEVKIDLEFI